MMNDVINPLEMIKRKSNVLSSMLKMDQSIQTLLESAVSVNVWGDCLHH